MDLKNIFIHYRWALILAAISFFSALMVVSNTHSSRMILSQMERLKIQEDALYLSHKQLLIERGMRLNLSVLQKTAEKKLRMYLPNPAEVIYISQ